MKIRTLTYRDWTFEFDKQLTLDTYSQIKESGADLCICNECKNYIAYRDKIFPNEILKLFIDVGIDYKKEIEIMSFETLLNGFHNISGWFHFKGKILKGKDCRVSLPNGGFTFDLTTIADNFSIGFSEANDLTFFNDIQGLVQIEFDTIIPWVIDKIREKE
ncbi:MAG: hypothetical protein RO257_04955 [Candidatus Kapabacteria bacterium]|nr:hypothetical protein [Candidatus Kapabacteria bacterium]